MAGIRRFLSAGLIFSFILTFFACSNPLSVSSISKDNEERSAKSNDLLSLVVSGGKFGITEPSGEVSYKVGSTFEISFTENDIYQFVKWEVLNAKSGEAVSDIVKIEDVNQMETTVNVIRAAENILLRPVCKVRPQLLSSFPDFADEGVFRDSIIIVTFDSPISEDSFYYSAEEIALLEADSLLSTDDNKVYGYTFNNEIFYKNLKITSGDDINLLEFFNPPVIESGSVIKIFPKEDKNPIHPLQNYLDIDVCLSPEIFDVNNVSIGAEGVQWRYRINSNTDTFPPEFTKFKLSKSAVAFDGDLLVSDKSFNPLNHIKNTVYYDCDAKDEGSGVGYLKVEAKRLQNSLGNAVEEEPDVQILKDLKGNVVLSNDDGLIQVSFSVFDLSGNESQTVYKYLIAKDTSVNLEGIHFFNKYDFKLEDSVTPQILNTASKSICWKNVPDDTWFMDNKTPATDLNYVLYWGTNKEKLSNVTECTKNSYNNGEWCVTLPELSSSGNIYLKLVVKDSVGNEKDISASLNVNPSFFTYQKVSDAGEYKYVDSNSGKEKTVPYPAHYRIFSSDGTIPGYLYYLYNDEQSLQTQSFLNLKYDEAEGKVLNSSEKYCDIYVGDISKCKFYFQSVLYSEDFTASDDAVSKLGNKLSEIQRKKNSGAFLKEIEAYNPDLRNAYLVAQLKGFDEEAEQILNGFYLWNYFIENNQNGYFTTSFVSPLSDFTITESKVLSAPVVDSIKIIKGNVNSGVNKAVVKYLTSSSNDTVYGFFWGTSEDSIINYQKETEFNIESGMKTLYFQTATTKTSTGENVISPVSVYDLSDYAFDTSAPKIGTFEKSEISTKPTEYRASEYYPVVTCDICYDDYEVTDGLAQYTLYVVPAESENQTFNQLSEDVISKSPSIVNTFTPPAKPDEKVTVWNYVEGLGSAKSYFYVIYLRDASGNYSYTPVSLSKQLLENVPQISFAQNEEDENLVDISFNIEKEVGYKDYQYVYNIFNAEEDKVIYYPCQSNTSLKDNFFFAYAKAVYKLGNLELTKFSYPVYFYSANETCELKDVIDGMNGAQIYCDKPCLVMTYWSSENYGYSIEDWEAFGVQSNIMYISAKYSSTNEYAETVKYYTVNYDEIPMGKYFVIVVHFADGTSLMSRNINTN